MPSVLSVTLPPTPVRLLPGPQAGVWASGLAATPNAEVCDNSVTVEPLRLPQIAYPDRLKTPLKPLSARASTSTWVSPAFGSTSAIRTLPPAPLTLKPVPKRVWPFWQVGNVERGAPFVPSTPDGCSITLMLCPPSGAQIAVATPRQSGPYGSFSTPWTRTDSVVPFGTMSVISTLP